MGAHKQRMMVIRKIEGCKIMSLQTDHLPVRLTPFVGRQDDLGRILDLIKIPSVQLVTILGPGGVGKTRLAIELARALHDRFEHGAVFIPLAQLNSTDELLPALAGVLRIQLPPGCDLQETVLEHLAIRQTLLVFDNFEHLLDEAVLISAILTKCPRVKVLVTSREKLKLEAETLYHLDGLHLPPRDTLKDAEKFDSIGLFLQKAALARPGFSLDPNNTSSVVQICRMVDGNALGILLAAAWLEYFSPAEIEQEICRSLDFLSSAARDAEPRHCCMRAVFDSSFNRLDLSLQSVLRKLAVFRGGFDLSAAAAIAGADVRTLLALVDKSLLMRDLHSGRYELHELLRQYTLERLEAAGEQASIMAAYANYYTTFVWQRERKLISPDQMTALDEIQADFDNIRQACVTAINSRDFVSVGAAISGLYAFCDMRSRFYEGEAIFRLASESLVPQANEPPHPAWALALLSWYDMRVYIEPFENFEEFVTSAKCCLEQAIAAEEAQAAAASLVLLGAIAEDQRDFKRAIQHYQKAMRYHPLLDDVYFVNIRIALCFQALQKYQEALDVFRICLRRGQQTGERVKTAWSLFNIGETLLMLEKPADAEQYLDQACTLFEHVGTTLGLVCCKYCSSRAAFALGDRSRGRELAEAASGYARQIHAPSWIAKIEKLLHQIDPQYAAVVNEMKFQGQEPLSSRELEVLQLLRSDLSGPAIAQRLVVSLNTVRYHTKNIYRKLGAGTRLEAIQRAKELGL